MWSSMIRVSLHCTWRVGGVWRNMWNCCWLMELTCLSRTVRERPHWMLHVLELRGQPKVHDTCVWCRDCCKLEHMHTQQAGSSTLHCTMPAVTAAIKLLKYFCSMELRQMQPTVQDTHPWTASCRWSRRKNEQKKALIMVLCFPGQVPRPCSTSKLDFISIFFSVLFFKVVDDYPDQHPELIARSLLNHGAKPPTARVSWHN